MLAPLVIIPILILLNNKSYLRNHYLLVCFFTNQLWLVLLFGSHPEGAYESGSILTNLITVFVSLVPLIILWVTRSKKNIFESTRSKLSTVILRGSWIAYLILGIYSAFSSKTKLMPVSAAIMFSLLLFLIFEGNFNFNYTLVAIYRVFSSYTTIIIFTYFVGFNWNQYIVGSQNELIDFESANYFSPLASFFNLPPRASGPFGNPQSAAVFSLFGISCYFAAKLPRKNFFVLISLITFGSLTGSRTFYVTLICIMAYYAISNKLPESSVAFWSSILIAMSATILILYIFILPKLLVKTTSLTNFTGRTTLWRLILNNWSSEGLLGHGPNTLREFATNHVYVSFAHAHNSVLQSLWDFGLLGFTCILLLIFSQILSISVNPSQRNRVAGILICLLIVQTEPTLQVEIGISSWFWLVPLIFVFSNINNNQSSILKAENQ